MTTPPSVKFNRKDRPEFFSTLRSRVNQYFKDNNISKHANFNMKFKTVFMLTIYTLPLLAMLFGAVTTLSGVFLMWVIMGIGMSGIGLSVMHDANHGSYSSNQKVNRLVSLVINYIGAYHVNWRIQHNVLHHSFTNIHEHDDDLANGVMRFSPDQPHNPTFHYQAFYAPFLYGIQSLYWYIAKDFVDIRSYREKNLIKGQGLTYRQALTHIIFNKTWYTVLVIVLPIMLMPFPWWVTIVGFLIMHFICGLTLALIFQPAHVIEETSFFKVDDNGSVENNWAIHQMRTTANFAHKSRLFSWFIGGLNFQVEHHLFPNICHVHYRGISKIVKETAAEFDVPYYEHETFYDAVASHFRLLHQLGTGEYDKKLATAA